MSHRFSRLLNRRPAAAVAALALGGLLTGCVYVPGWQPEMVEVRHVPDNYLGDLQLPATLQRVVLLPVCGGDLADPDTVAALDPVFAAALQAERRFEVVPVSRAWCRRHYGTAEFSSTGALPPDLLARLGREYAADAVLFVDLTAYRDQRPLTLGVRAKLATIEQTRLVWNYDEILSAADAGVANSARAHARATGRSDLPVDLSVSALQSPARFAAYVADTAFGTLPAR